MGYNRFVIISRFYYPFNFMICFDSLMQSGMTSVTNFFNFKTKGVKRAEVSLFGTTSIILSRNKTSLLVSTLNSVLVHPTNRFFCSGFSTFSTKYWFVSQMMPSSPAFFIVSTVILISSSISNDLQPHQLGFFHPCNQKGQFFHLVVVLHWLKLFYIHL